MEIREWLDRLKRGNEIILVNANYNQCFRVLRCSDDEKRHEFRVEDVQRKTLNNLGLEDASAALEQFVTRDSRADYGRIGKGQVS